MNYAVELLNVTKRFARTIANEDVTLSIPAGQILALVGENGAGKTTLMKTIYGLYQPDAGVIRINGREVSIRSPVDSIRLGIGMVHQHFMLVPPLTVLENIVLGAEPVRGAWLDLGRARAEIEEVAEKYSLKVSLDEKVENIGVGIQQRVEILKALYRGANILILDEPTAVLTPQESDELFKILRELKAQGKTIILITHKLKEVLAVSDRIAVMRKGKITGTLETSKTSTQEIAELMVGRSVILELQKPDKISGESLLTVIDLSHTDKRGVPVLQNVSLEVHAGEILGIAGVEGNGQSQLVECIAGMIRARFGAIKLKHADIAGLTPREIFAAGLAHIPEDRLKRGLVADFPIRDNLILGLQNQERFSSAFYMRRNRIEQNALALVERFDVRPADIHAESRALSGGNQQKVVIARELSRGADVIIASQPTRGVDIGAIEFIHQTLVRARNDGKAILLISADLNEILSLSDRIAVMYSGKIIKTFPAERCMGHDRVDERELGIYMAGFKGANR